MIGASPKLADLDGLLRARNRAADRMCEMWLSQPRNGRDRAKRDAEFARLRASVLDYDSQLRAIQRRYPNCRVDISFAPNAISGRSQQRSMSK